MTAALELPQVAHPCPFTVRVLDEMARELDLEAERLGVPRLAVLDPFAGTGQRVMRHPTYAAHTWVGLELEESFIAAPWVMPGNALRVPFGARSFHAIATSFVFPGRMTDSFVSGEADKSERMTYSHKARENRGDRTYRLHQDNAGAMKWGEPYRKFHIQAIAEGRRVLGSGGLFLVEMKDHRVKGERVPVTAWFVDEFQRQGCTIEGLTAIPVRGNRKGSKDSRNEREDHSTLIIARVGA